MRRVVGVDGCRGGWIAVEARADLTSARAFLFPDLAAVIAAFDGALTAIDMPIGLVDGPEGRGADTAARAMLGPRRSSVFTPPCRTALTCDAYAVANAAQRRITGKGLSKQAWMLAPKLREADAAARAVGQDRLFESHPELAFTLASGAPMAAHKTTLHGLFERLRVLARLGLDPAALAADLPAGVTAQADDLIDACILAHVAARRLRGAAMRLPETPRRDPAGLWMEIWA